MNTYFSEFDDEQQKQLRDIIWFFKDNHGGEENPLSGMTRKEACDEMRRFASENLV